MQINCIVFDISMDINGYGKCPQAQDTLNTFLDVCLLYNKENISTECIYNTANKLDVNTT